MDSATGAWEDPWRPANGFIPGFSTKIQVSDARLGSGSVKRQCRTSTSKSTALIKIAQQTKAYLGLLIKLNGLKLQGSLKLSLPQKDRPSQDHQLLVIILPQFQ